MPYHFDPPGYRVLGKRWEFQVTVTSDGTAPLALTGATITAAIGTGPGAAPIATKQSPHDDITINPDQVGAGKGKVAVVWTPDDTREFRVPANGLLAYEINVEFGPDSVDSVADGYIRVKPSMLD